VKQTGFCPFLESVLRNWSNWLVDYPPGHYNLESLAKEIGDLFTKYNYKLETETDTTACNQKFWVKTD